MYLSQTCCHFDDTSKFFCVIMAAYNRTVLGEQLRAAVGHISIVSVKVVGILVVSTSRKRLDDLHPKVTRTPRKPSTFPNQPFIGRSWRCTTSHRVPRNRRESPGRGRSATAPPRTSQNTSAPTDFRRHCRSLYRARTAETDNSSPTPHPIVTNCPCYKQTSRYSR